MSHLTIIDAHDLDPNTWEKIVVDNFMPNPIRRKWYDPNPIVLHREEALGLMYLNASEYFLVGRCGHHVLLKDGKIMGMADQDNMIRYFREGLTLGEEKKPISKRDAIRIEAYVYALTSPIGDELFKGIDVEGDYHKQIKEKFYAMMGERVARNSLI